MADFATHGPITVEVTFHLTDEERDVAISFDCPAGDIPPPEGIAILAQKALEVATQQVGPGFAFMTRDKFVQEQLIKKTGADMRFAVPEGAFSAEWAK